MEAKEVKLPTVSDLRTGARAHGRFVKLVRACLFHGMPGWEVIEEAARADYVAAGGGRPGGQVVAVYKMAVKNSTKTDQEPLALTNTGEKFTMGPAVPRAKAVRGAGKNKATASREDVAKGLLATLTKAVELALVDEALAAEVGASVAEALANGKREESPEVARKRAAVGEVLAGMQEVEPAPAPVAAPRKRRAQAQAQATG